MASEFGSIDDLKKELDIEYKDGEVVVGHSKGGLTEKNSLSEDLIGDEELKKAAN